MVDFNNIEALLLDLDGTLINTEQAFYKSYKEVLSSYYDITIDSSIYKKCELDKNATLLDTLRKTNSILINVTNEEIMSKVFECYTDKFIEVITQDDVIERFNLLKIIKQSGYKLALVTTCNKYYLNILVEKLNINNLFDCIIAREDVTNLKPANDAYLKALEIINVSPEDCLVLEDSIRGIDAAYSANIRNIIKVNEFTLVKFDDKRCLTYSSSNDVFNQIIQQSKQSSRKRIID